MDGYSFSCNGEGVINQDTFNIKMQSMKAIREKDNLITIDWEYKCGTQFVEYIFFISVIYIFPLL